MTITQNATSQGSESLSGAGSFCFPCTASHSHMIQECSLKSAHMAIVRCLQAAAQCRALLMDGAHGSAPAKLFARFDGFVQRPFLPAGLEPEC